METLENSNITEINSYVTYVFGTIGELENCYEIILCLTDESNKLTESSLGAQTSTNTGNLKINNITITQYDKVKRNNLKEDFLFSKADLGNGFNTIIYLDQSERNIGYTEFLNIQGLIPEFIRIKLSFSASVNIGNDIRTENKLVILQEELDEKVRSLFNGKNYGFINFKDIKNNLEKSTDDIYPRYTKHLTELSRSENLSILLNQGICTPFGLRKLNLVKEMTIAEDLINHQLGYYRGEIVLYSWKQNEDNTWEYSVHSMSSKDKFGNPICYTKTSSGTKFIVEPKLGSIKNIRYFSGKFISVLLSPVSGGNDILGVYNLETENWVELELSNHVMDLWGINSRITELPRAKELSKNSTLAFCPDIINTHFNIKNYDYSIDIIKKVGSWYVLRQERTWENKGVINNKVHSFRIYTNFNKTIVLSDTNDNTKDPEPIIINDNILALRTTSEDLDYYTYFVGDGWMYSENALLSIYKGINNLTDYNLTKESGILQFIARTGLAGLPVKNNNNLYKNKMLVVDHIGSDFLDSYLFNFRRSLCPPKQEVPVIIGSINGLIYYKTKNNKIKLL